MSFESTKEDEIVAGALETPQERFQRLANRVVYLDPDKSPFTLLVTSSHSAGNAIDVFKGISFNWEEK